MDFKLISSVFETLRIAPPLKLTLLEAQTLSSAHVPPYPPDMPVLFTGMDSNELILQVKTVLLTTYPKEHIVQWVIDGKKKETTLGEMSEEMFGKEVCLFVPALEDGTSFESFAEIVAHLRAPDGCPWDREQTHETLRKHLLEESYAPPKLLQ